MKISCLTITQPGRFELFRRAVHDLERQTWQNRELIVVVDGPESYREQIESFCKGRPVAAKVLLGAGPTLGDFRNESVKAATGQILCHWDDDDRYHSQRLELQAQALLKTGSDFCYLSGFWHYFADTDELSWVDWRRKGDGQFHPELPHFRSFCPAMMALKSSMIPYPSQSTGEDSMLCTFMFLRKLKVHVMEGYGWCYVYNYHGGNLTARHHHEHMNHHRSRPLSHAEIESVAEKMKREFDSDFSLETVLAQYGLQHKSFTAPELPA